MSVILKAIMTGTICDGFSIAAVVPEEQAENIVVAHLANGTLAEALQIFPASDLDKRKKFKSKTGTEYVVFGKGLGNGFSVYGPFEDDNLAEEFGEDHRDEDEEWEVFSFKPSIVPNVTEILQHRIEWWLSGDDAPTELDECSIEHIESLIKGDYREGELCVSVPGVTSESNTTEFRGWWTIAKSQ